MIALRQCTMALCLALVASFAQAEELQDLLRLEQEFNAHYKAGRNREAESVGRRLVEMAERSFANEPGIVAICLDHLGDLYNRLERPTDAEPLYRRALGLRETSLGDHPHVATSHNHLARLYWGQGRYADAEPHFKQALQVREKVLGPNHADVTDSLNSLAALYYMLGRYSEAEPLFQRALTIREQTAKEKPLHVAESANNLAALYADQGRLDEAEALFRRGLKLREQALGAQHAAVADSLFNLAKLATEQGRYAESQSLHERALAIREKALGTKHPGVAYSLTGIASLLSSQGRQAEAEPLYRRALAIREESLGKDHPNVASSLNNLAALAYEQKRYAEAEPLFKRALAINEKQLGADTLDVAYGLNGLAIVYDCLDRPDEATPLLERSLKIRQKTLGAAHPEVAASLNNLAMLHYGRGRYAAAEPYVEQALGIDHKTGNRPEDLWWHRQMRALVLWHTDRRDLALTDLQLAIDAAESMRGRFSGGERERSQGFAHITSPYELMIAWQTELGKPAAVFAAIERSHARTLIDQLATAHVDLLKGLAPVEAKRLRDRDQLARAKLAGLEKQLSAVHERSDLALAEQKRQVAALEAAIEAARQEVADAYAALRNSSPAYRQMVGRDFQPLSLDEVQRRLAGPVGLVLTYALGDEAGYLLVIPPVGQAPRIERLQLDAELAGELGVEPGPLNSERLQRALTFGDLSFAAQLKSGRPLQPRLAALWKALIPEATRKQLIDGSLGRLLIVPDGPLSQLPFELLVVERGTDPKYLLDVGPAVHYGPSTTALCNVAERNIPATVTDRKPVLTVSDPAYGQLASTPSHNAEGAAERFRTGGGTLQRLPYAGTESNWLAEVFLQQGFATGKLLQTLATEGAARFNVAGRRCVHFACHGQVHANYGNLFGALALVPAAGAVDSADDGFLTLAEIYDLDLKGCELAVLSACDTNLGPQQRGEGAWALSRGFLVAGSKRVVASNWRVDDEATAHLVSIFGSHIARGWKAGQLDYAAALQQAKRHVRQQEKWRSPYYWAPLVLVGPE